MRVCRLVSPLNNGGTVRFFKRALLLLGVVSLSLSTAYGQGVGINESGADPDNSAMLDIQSNTRGLLIPRLTKAAKLAIPLPANGLMVYQIDDTIGFWYYDVNMWKPVFQHVTAGPGLTGGKLQAYGTISLTPTGITTGQYGTADSIPQFTVNQFGQLVFARNLAINEKDGVIGNEITDTSGANGMLTRNGSGTVMDPYTVGIQPGINTNDIWVWDGNQWTLQQYALEKDSVVGNEIADTNMARGVLIRNGNGSSANPYTIGVSAGSNIGDVWMWDGTKWVSSPIQMPIEQDSVIGNEIADTTNARGVLERYGAGTAGSPYQIGVTAGNAVGDVWMWDGTKWVSAPIIHPTIIFPLEKDSVIGNEIADTTSALGILNRFGSGTDADPYRVGINSGIDTGHVWMWDGAKWVSSPIIHPTLNLPLEKDSVIGNEIADTTSALGMLNRFGAGTDADPYRIGMNSGLDTGHVWMWDGAKWVSSPIIHPAVNIPLEKDSVIGNEIADTSAARGVLTRGGSGTDADPYTLGVTTGNNVGDVWMWNGSTWVPMQIIHPREQDSVIGNELADTINSRGIINKVGAGTNASPYQIAVNAGDTIGDVWMWNGTTWSPTQITHPIEVDAIIGNEVADTITNGFLQLLGAGTAASPKMLGLKPGDSIGHVLIWNGTSWYSGKFGRNTLDMAYDQGGPGAGRVIIADAGVVDITGTDGLLVRGTLNSGVTAGSLGSGVRMFFNPRTAAFRAGGAIGTSWDAGSLGNYSAAFGLGTIADANYTFATGLRSEAHGNNSIAMGDSARTLLQHSVAIGEKARTGGRNTFSIGTGNYAYGEYTYIYGNNSTTLGNHSGILGEECLIDSRAAFSTAIGYRDTINATHSLAMGYLAKAGGDSSIALGTRVWTDNPYCVVIGNNSAASGDKSMALGNYVTTNNKSGAVIIGDGSTTTQTQSHLLNTMTMRFHNGYRLYTNGNLSTYASLANGATAWAFTSDRNTKENIEDINGEEILFKIKEMPITKWNYIANPDDVKYIGPMAQDFHAAFGLAGSDSCSINSLAIDGLNLAAIKALVERTEKIQTLEDKIDAQDAQIEEMRAELRAIRELLEQRN